MYIRHIDLKNVRCFEHVDLTLVPDGASGAGWTVLAGRNGTGKSTLLQAFALALTGEPTVLFDARAKDWITWGETAASLKPSLDVNEEDQFTLLDNPGYAEEDWARVTSHAMKQRRQPQPLDYEIHWGSSTGMSIGETEDGLELSLRGPLYGGAEPLGWFAAGYGPSRRLGLASEPPRWSRREGGVASLFDEGVGLQAGIEALQRLNYQALSPAMPDAVRAESARIEVLAIDLLNDLLRARGARVIGVAPDGLRVMQGDRERRIERMSDGYRVVVALVLDLLLKMHAAFGERLRAERTRDPRGEDQTAVLNAGVVLVDEIEQHLHPSWQQEIGFWLMEHFPRVQFVVATHSPFVCQAASAGRLFRVYAASDGTSNVAPVSEQTYAAVVHGTVDEAVMSELFGVEHLFSRRTEQLRAEAADLEVKAIRGSASPSERERLREILSQLPSNDGSLARQSLKVLERL